MELEATAAPAPLASPAPLTAPLAPRVVRAATLSAHASAPSRAVDADKDCGAGAAATDTTAGVDDLDTDEYTEEHNAMGNGCGEAVSPPSSCADTFALGPAPVAASKPSVLLRVAGASHALEAPPPPAAAASAPILVSPSVRLAVVDGVASASRPLTIKIGATGASAPTFAAQAMHAVAQHAAAAPRPSLPGCSSRSDLSCGAGEDPMGVRQLYSLPSSRAGSVLGGAPAPSLPGPREASALTAPAATGADAFSMERFASFYEAALEELVTECERRVANAPAAWRDSQRHFICGDNNRDLATSTRSFDSPRSGAMSPLGVAPSSMAASCSTPVYPPCYSNHAHNTHGLHRRSGGADAASVTPTSAAGTTASLPPQLSTMQHHSRSVFFSAAAASQRGPTVAEESVPALLAALGRHHGKMAPMVFIAALAYLARVTVQCASELLSITRENWYRLTTTAILVAAKVYDEHSSSRLNAHFARSAGIALSEMTRLELDFLYLIDFDLLLKEAEVEQWLSWMETLAVRRDLMTPLNTYVLGATAAGSNLTATTATAAATATATAAATTMTATNGSTSAAAHSGFPGSPAPSSSMAGFQLAQYKERSKMGATCDGSHTVGLSSEGLEHGEEMVLTSPSSIVDPRSFSHARVASGVTAYMGGASFSRRPTAATVFAAGDAPFFTGPMLELVGMPPRSPASSVVQPNSVMDGACSVLSAASLPGAAASSLQGRRAVVPPSPVHGVLPLRPATAKSRLFSVVHGRAEPPSPISVRQLGRLGASPPSPLRPPSQERHSPVRFFKPQGPHRGAGGHGLLSTGAASARVAASQASSKAFAAEQPAPAPGKGKADTRAASGAAAAGAAGARHGTAANADTQQNSGGSSKRWGPFGMVRHVRDVLGVTASLVRGQLNVLAPSSPAEAHGRPPPPERAAPPSKPISGSGSRVSQHATTTVSSAAGAPYPPFPARLSDERATTGLRRPPPCSSPQPPSPAAYLSYRRSPAVRGSPRPVDAEWTGKPRSQVAAVAPSHVSPPPPAAVEAAEAYDDVYEEGEEGEWYEEDEECDYGYYDDAGVFHYYEDEEDGDYDEEGEWYEEEEDEAAYFQRCRPPLTHSPPSL